MSNQTNNPFPSEWSDGERARVLEAMCGEDPASDRHVLEALRGESPEPDQRILEALRGERSMATYPETVLREAQLREAAPQMLRNVPITEVMGR